MATLPAANIGYIGSPITTMKLSHHRTIDLFTLICSAVHTYHPEKTETIIVHHQDMKN